MSEQTEVQETTATPTGLGAAFIVWYADAGPDVGTAEAFSAGYRAALAESEAARGRLVKALIRETANRLYLEDGGWWRWEYLNEDVQARWIAKARAILSDENGEG